MMVVNLILIAACAVAGGGAQENTADVIAPGAKLEKLWGEGFFTEGGRWPATGRSCSPTSATGS